jgi:hypothetical protein
MKLSSEQVRKIDPELYKALKQAKGHEPLRTIMVLATGLSKSANQIPQSADFSDRTAYRKALIDTQKQLINEQLSVVKQALNDYSLSVKGGDISQAVVVEGSAGNILSSLDLPAVKYASLDKELSIY